ncbi:sentrin-specific protease 8 isoform X2 [Anabrus simplex]
MDPVVLNFHDTLLHQSDVDLLDGPYWLNDSIISFYFEYLENVAYEGDRRFLFIGPEVTQCLKVSHWRDLTVFLEPLKLKQHQFCFFAVNDCEMTEKPGGTHWSLLVYSKPENMFFHYDSSAGHNCDQAWKLATNLSKYMSIEMEFIETDCLQQNNCYDCGIHLLCNVDHIANYSARNGKVKGAGLIKPIMVNTKRSELKELIESLSENRH